MKKIGKPSEGRWGESFFFFFFSSSPLFFLFERILRTGELLLDNGGGQERGSQWRQGSRPGDRRQLNSASKIQKLQKNGGLNRKFYFQYFLMKSMAGDKFETMKKRGIVRRRQIRALPQLSWYLRLQFPIGTVKEGN